MTKNDKKVLYMNDVPMFRAIMGGFVFAYYVFLQLWTYWLSPLSHYRRDYFEPTIYEIFPITCAVLFYIAFLVLNFISLKKSWRYIFLINSIFIASNIISNILYQIHDYSLRQSLGMDVDAIQYFMSILPILLLYGVMSFVYLRPFFQRKYSKYAVVIVSAIILFLSVINLLLNIKESIDFYNSDTYNGWRQVYYYGFLLSENEIDYHLATQVIVNIPLLSIYYFFLSLFISIKKPEPAPVSPSFEYNPYQPQMNSFQYPVQSPEVRSTAEVVNNQNITEPTVSVNTPVTFSADDIPIAPRYECTIPVSAPTPIMEQEPTQAPYIAPAFCNQCGYKMPDDFAFCPKCGKKFR